MGWRVCRQRPLIALGILSGEMGGFLCGVARQVVGDIVCRLILGFDSRGWCGFDSGFWQGEVDER